MTSDDELSLSAAMRAKRGPRSLRQVAQETGISVATLSRVERGELPSMPTYHRLQAWLAPEQPKTVAQQHVAIDRIVEDARRQLHDTLKAEDNARALARHRQAVANQQRPVVEAARAYQRAVAAIDGVQAAEATLFRALDALKQAPE